MSLLDTFLLEASRVNMWIALRSDGTRGSGTLSDPYVGTNTLRMPLQRFGQEWRLEDLSR